MVTVKLDQPVTCCVLVQVAKLVHELAMIATLSDNVLIRLAELHAMLLQRVEALPTSGMRFSQQMETICACLQHLTSASGGQQLAQLYADLSQQCSDPEVLCLPVFQLGSAMSTAQKTGLSLWLLLQCHVKELTPTIAMVLG